MNQRDQFEQLSDAIGGMLQAGEVFTASYSAEDSDFIRFNKGAVRQAGSVSQSQLTLDLIEGRRHCAATVGLTGDLELDRPRLARLVTELREKRAFLPEDPYLLYATDVRSSEAVRATELPEGAAAISEVQQASAGRDLVGIYAAGGIHTGFANSFGQRNWHTTTNFNLDWSFYHQADKAVKSSYAGFEWDAQAFQHKVSWAAAQLDVLRHTSHTIQPGRYRVYLAPAALCDITAMLASGGFGLKSHKTKQSPLLRMVEHGERLSPALSILENTGEGVAPNFQEDGFIRPDRVALIEGGAYRDWLVSPRSAAEYGTETNGASADETPESVEVAAGDLQRDDVLSKLGTGVYVSNVWYLNWSDLPACRTTGMTRFATFWVENGEIKAPLSVMRFDETAYRMLGANLQALTTERELVLDPSTYFGRSTYSGRIPGALVEDFTFTL